MPNSNIHSNFNAFYTLVVLFRNIVELEEVISQMINISPQELQKIRIILATIDTAEKWITNNPKPYMLILLCIQKVINMAGDRIDERIREISEKLFDFERESRISSNYFMNNQLLIRNAFDIIKTFKALDADNSFRSRFEFDINKEGEMEEVLTISYH